MSKEELEKEVEDKGVEYADSLEYTIPKFSDTEGYCWSQIEQAYEKGALDFAEPREKCIAELEEENNKIKSLLKEIYEEYGFCELVKIRNDLPLEVQEAIKIFK